MNTETLDKLYLEWSQFTKSKTAREIELEATIKTQNDVLDVVGEYLFHKPYCSWFTDERLDKECDCGLREIESALKPLQEIDDEHQN